MARTAAAWQLTIRRLAFGPVPFDPLPMAAGFLRIVVNHPLQGAHMHIRHARGWRAASVITAAAFSASMLLAAASLASYPATMSATAPVEIGAAPSTYSSPTEQPAVDDLHAFPARDGAAAVSGLGLALLAPTAQPQVIAPRDPPAQASGAYGLSNFAVVSDVPFTQAVDCGRYSCQVELDIYQPSGRGPFPTVVLVRGGPGGLGGRRYLDNFARELASHGLLVFNADYRDVADEGGGYPAAFQDVSCAVRFARSQATRYGGDGGPVTLVGHSLGGWVGSVVALDADEFKGGCLADGSGRPDAFVGLAGNYQIDAGEVDSDLYVFFGGSASATAAARAASNPFGYATRSPIPVRLVAGGWDTTVYPSASIALNAFLMKRGWNVGLTLVPGASHMSILDSGNSGSPSMAAVFSAVSAVRSAEDYVDPVKARLGQ
jgi:acetyl esterase/lipase